MSVLLQTASNAPTYYPSAPPQTVTQAFTYNNVAGNSILVILGMATYEGSTVAVNSISDTQGNSYALAASTISGAAHDGLVIYLATNIKAGANTVSVTAVAQDFSLIIVEYSGTLTVDQVATHVLSSVTSITTGNITTTSASEVLISAGYATSSLGHLTSANYYRNAEAITQYNENSAFADGYVLVTGAYGDTWSGGSGSGNMHAILVGCITAALPVPDALYGAHTKEQHSPVVFPYGSALYIGTISDDDNDANSAKYRVYRSTNWNQASPTWTEYVYNLLASDFWYATEQIGSTLYAFSVGLGAYNSLQAIPFDMVGLTFGSAITGGPNVYATEGSPDFNPKFSVYSDGTNVHLLYQSAPETIGGINYPRLSYATFNGSTWTTVGALPGEAGNTHGYYPAGIARDSSGRVHFHITVQMFTGASAQIQHVAYTSGSFSSAQTAISATGAADSSTTIPSSESTSNVSMPVVFTDGSEKIGFLYLDTNSPNGLRMATAPVADVPTWSTELVTGDAALTPGFEPNSDAFALVCSLVFTQGSYYAFWEIIRKTTPTILRGNARPLYASRTSSGTWGGARDLFWLAPISDVANVAEGFPNRFWTRLLTDNSIAIALGQWYQAGTDNFIQYYRFIPPAPTKKKSNYIYIGTLAKGPAQLPA